MTAEEMFEELGYKKIKNDKHFISYSDNKYKTSNSICEKIINFNLEQRTVWCEIKDELGLRNTYFIPKEVKATNKQLKELGW